MHSIIHLGGDLGNAGVHSLLQTIYSIQYVKYTVCFFFLFFSFTKQFAFSISSKLVSELLSIPGTCHVSRAVGFEARAAQTRPLAELDTAQTSSKLRTKLLTLRAFLFFFLGFCLFVRAVRCIDLLYTFILLA